MGMVPGKPGYYDLDKNRFAYPIRHVILYRFSEDMFFANIKILQSDIEQAVEDTQDEIKAVIIDSEAVNSIDFTAADAIEMLSDSLEKRGIRFYMTGHTDKINAQMRHLGLGHLIAEGRVRRTVLSALKDAGIEVPCELDIPEKDKSRLERVGNRAYPQGEEYTLEEFVWAFGEGAGKRSEAGRHTSWRRSGPWMTYIPWRSAVRTVWSAPGDSWANWTRNFCFAPCCHSLTICRKN